MKIISKFKDYYDNVQGVMYDESIRFIRKSEDIDVADIVSLPYYSEPDYRKFYLIGFCDKIYVVHRYEYGADCHNSEKIDKYINKHKKKLVTVNDGGGKRKYHNSYDIQESIMLNPDRSMLYFNRKGTEASILNVVEGVKSLGLFDKFETPIFSIRAGTGHREVILDTSPTLRNFNFESQFDPFTAYQELVMWIGNKAVNEYPPQITDNIVLRDAKGFDKWSFKTMKGQKKKRGGR